MRLGVTEGFLLKLDGFTTEFRCQAAAVQGFFNDLNIGTGFLQSVAACGMPTQLKFTPNSIQLQIQNEMMELGNMKIRMMMMEEDTIGRVDLEDIRQIPVRITSCKPEGVIQPTCNLTWELPIQDQDGPGYLEKAKSFASKSKRKAQGNTKAAIAMRSKVMTTIRNVKTPQMTQKVEEGPDQTCSCLLGTIQDVQLPSIWDPRYVLCV